MIATLLHMESKEGKKGRPRFRVVIGSGGRECGWAPSLRFRSPPGYGDLDVACCLWCCRRAMNSKGAVVLSESPDTDALAWR